MKKWLLLVVLLLSGCWDVDEPERMLYLYGMGVDYKDGEYIVHAQIIDFSNIAKSEQPNNPDAIQAEVGTAKGSNISEAIYQLYESMDQKVFWGHFTYIVFSEEALKDGRANTVINTFIRFHETRYNTWVYGTKDSVKDVMLTTPLINKAISLSKLSDPHNAYKQDSFIEPINFRKLIIQLNGPGHEVNIPLISLIKNWETKKEQDQTTKINGVAVVTPSAFKGILEGEKAQGLQWMSRESVRANMAVTVEEFKQQNLSISLTNSKVEVTPHITGTDVKFDITIQGVATLISFNGPISAKEVKEAATKQIIKEVRATFEEGLKKDMDIYRFSEPIYRKHLSVWKEIEKDGKIPLTKDSLREIDIQIVEVNIGRKDFVETIELENKK